MTDIIGVGLERKGQEIERAVLVGTDRLADLVAHRAL